MNVSTHVISGMLWVLAIYGGFHTTPTDLEAEHSSYRYFSYRIIWSQHLLPHTVLPLFSILMTWFCSTWWCLLPVGCPFSSWSSLLDNTQGWKMLPVRCEILTLLLPGEDPLARWASSALSCRARELARSSSPSSSAPTTMSSLHGAFSILPPRSRFVKQLFRKQFQSPHCSRHCLGPPAPTGGTLLDAMHRFWPKHLTEKCCQTKQKS